MDFDLLRRELGEGHDGEAVASFAKVGYGSIKDNTSATSRGANRVGLKAMPICLVADEDFLVGRDASLLEKILVDRHAPFVVDIGVGYDGAVDLGIQDFFQHEATLRLSGGRSIPANIVADWCLGSLQTKNAYAGI